MYYNVNTQTIVSSYPSNIKLDNGSMICGDNLDTNLLAELGYYTIRNDNSVGPVNTIENISNRVINLEKPYADITRDWQPIPTSIPYQISARQIRLWLIQNNISLTSVENAINGIVDETLREKTLVEWEFAPYVERNHPLTNTLGSTLGLTSQQIDQAFIEASIL